MTICAFFRCVSFRAGQFLSKFRRKYINAVLIIAHSLFPRNLCTNFRARINFVVKSNLVRAKISSNKVFKVYTIFSKQKLFRVIVHYHLAFIISILYLWIDTNFFSSFPCFTATVQDNPSWQLNSENSAKVRLLWKVSK